MSTIYTIILAAGKGTRMKSSLPKVLHQIGGLSLIEHVVRLAKKIKSKDIALVVSKDHQAIKDSLDNNLNYAIQHQQRGTGDALKAGFKNNRLKSGMVLVLSGDMPFISIDSINRLINDHQSKKSAMGLLTARVKDAKGLGRILRKSDGSVLGIVEEKDASDLQKKICEINMGIYIYDCDFLQKNINKLNTKNEQGEYYITDLVKLAVEQGTMVSATIVEDSLEPLGVNSQRHLYYMNHLFYQRQRNYFMDQGVCLLGSEIFIDTDVKIASGVVIESPCYLKGHSKIKENVHIESGCTLRDSEIAEDTLIKSHSYLDGAKIGRSCQIGPFAHLRTGTVLKNKAKVGNFVETKKTVLGESSKANHLTYLGDATIGKNVNVGAGTITCNYDGYKKYKTVLEDGVFIGSDTQLVAPVKIGKGSFVGAGTTVTSNVGKNSLVISRVPQKEILGWANKHRQKNS